MLSTFDPTMFCTVMNTLPSSHLIFKSILKNYAVIPLTNKGTESMSSYSIGQSYM